MCFVELGLLALRCPCASEEMLLRDFSLMTMLNICQFHVVAKAIKTDLGPFFGLETNGEPVGVP